AAADLLHGLLADAQASGEVRAEALAVLNDLDDPRLLDAIATAGASESSDLRMATLPILARLSPKQALPILTKMAAEGSAKEQQPAFDAIADLSDPGAAALLLDGLNRLKAGDVPYLAQFELLDAAEASGDTAVQTALADVQAYWTQ